jgi:hypothetical protein
MEEHVDLYDSPFDLMPDDALLLIFRLAPSVPWAVLCTRFCEVWEGRLYESEHSLIAYSHLVELDVQRDLGIYQCLSILDDKLSAIKERPGRYYVTFGSIYEYTNHIRKGVQHQISNISLRDALALARVEISQKNQREEIIVRCLPVYLNGDPLIAGHILSFTFCVEGNTRVWMCENYTYVNVDDWDLDSPLQQLGNFPKPRIVEKITHRFLGDVDVVASPGVEPVSDLGKLKEIIALLSIAWSNNQ